MTRQIRVGGVPIGGGAPVTIQSMTNTRTDDVSATAEQIKRLAAAGCEIVRVAVPDLAAARAVGAIRERSPIPLVADIHFDYRLALECVAAGCDKVRINPGNFVDPARTFKSLTYTDEEVETYYNEHKNNFDVADYEYIYFKGTANSTKDADGNTVQATDEEQAAAKEAAKELGSRLGRGCRIVTGRKKGRIELEYYGVEDLNQLLDALHALKTK